MTLGDHSTPSYVKESILRHASIVIDGLLDERTYQKKQKRAFHLEECDDEVFVAFLYWTHYKRMPDYLEEMKSYGQYWDEAETSYFYQALLMRIIVFAEAYCMSELKVAAVEALIPILTLWGTSLELADYAYEHAPERSIVRQMFLMQGVYECFRVADPISDREVSREEVQAIVRNPQLVENILAAMAIREHAGHASQTTRLDFFKPAWDVFRDLTNEGTVGLGNLKLEVCHRPRQRHE